MKLTQAKAELILFIQSQYFSYDTCSRYYNQFSKYYSMDIQKNLQFTSDVEPIITESFIYNGKFTDLFLYEDKIAFTNVFISRIIPINFDMIFEVMSADGMEIGLRIYDGQELHSFQREFWNRSEDWERELIKRMKQKCFHEFFKPVKKIGRGNFANVYLAEDLKNNRMVAVKAFVKEAAYKNHGKRALDNQIKILRKFNHENLIRLYGVYETQNSLYLVMEYAEGITLQTYLKMNKEIPLEARKKIIKKIINGLAELSTKGILHRDIKPDNIVISKDLDTLKILDFGLATEVDIDDYIFVRCGTPGFVAPQILRIRDKQPVHLHTISDIFSAGAIFYQMIYGKPLFDSKDHNQILNLNRNCKILLSDNENLANGEFQLLYRMLELSPHQRISAVEAIFHFYFSGEESNKENAGKQKTKLVNSGYAPKKQQLKDTFSVKQFQRPF